MKIAHPKPKLGDIDDKTKLKICGFIRNYEKEYTITIPEIIQFVIMLYYWIHEKFVMHGQGIILDKNSNIATRTPSKTKPAYSSIYGNVIDFNDTSITIYKWRFRLNCVSSNSTNPISIGIDATKFD